MIDPSAILPFVKEVTDYAVTNFPDELTLAIGAAVSPVMALVIKWLSVQKDITKWALVAGASFVAMFVNYLLHPVTASPESAATMAIVVGFLNHPYYKLIIQPLGKKFGAALATAVAVNQEAKSAAVPAGGLPAVTAPLTAPPLTASIEQADFSQ